MFVDPLYAIFVYLLHECLIHRLSPEIFCFVGVQLSALMKTTTPYTCNPFPRLFLKRMYSWTAFTTSLLPVEFSSVADGAGCSIYLNDSHMGCRF